MVTTSKVLAFVALTTLATSGVNAHGTLSKPGLKFTGTGYGGNFAALVPMTALTPQQGDIFTNYPDAGLNAAAFGRAFKASKYTSLKEFLLTNQDMSKGRSNMPKTPECGFTDPTSGPVEPLPDQVEWYGGKMNHDGPCEIWCDDEIVLPFTVNCAVTYPEGKFPYEKSQCVGKKRLTMYWMSTLMEWQVYIDCAKIGEGGPPASAATSTTSANTTSTTPSPASNAGGNSDGTQATMPTETPAMPMGSIGGEASSETKPRCKGKASN
ncbi:Hypothetical protein PHPALM_15314 [Phytophthora palmivora]|uniref:Uncharacterized protein n=1 Tax=Phytophthora palmivora TaxID=4796 RepID=A0A2P4XSI9_9STRA|nr:Hypothetical protein PHPALM_15314 [Phytophthora palmivora]